MASVKEGEGAHAVVHMELAPDCDETVAVTLMAELAKLPWEAVEQLQSKGDEWGRAGDGVDCCNIASLRHSPAEDQQQPRSDEKPEEQFDLQRLLISTLTEDSVSSVGHHISPLECIKELDEVDEQGSDPCRSPGDGAVGTREGVAETGSLVSSDEQDSPGAKRALSGIGLAPAFKFAVSPQRAKLDSETAGLLNKPLGNSQDNLLQVKLLHMQLEEITNGNGSCSGSGVYNEETHSSATEIHQPGNGPETLEPLHKNLETSATSLEELQNLKVEHQLHQGEINSLFTELRNSQERIAALESELRLESEKDEKQDCQILELESETPRSSLIVLLTKCQSKIEQLEDIKHSSLEFRVQLQAAQGLAACLQRKVDHLEAQHILKQQQVLELTEELAAAREALQEKSAEIAHVTAQLQVLQQQRENMRDSGVCSQVPANGHTTAQPQSLPVQCSHDSKVCTLL